MYQIRGALWWMWFSDRVRTIGCSLSMWNGYAIWFQQIIVRDWSISQLGPDSHLRSVWDVCLFSFVPRVAEYWKFSGNQFTAAIFFVCFDGRWNWVDKLLYLIERCLFVWFWSKHCHEIWLSTGKMRNSMQTVKQPISVLHWIFTYKRNNTLLIDWATHFPCIKVFAVWGVQFVSALVNRLKAASSP